MAPTVWVILAFGIGGVIGFAYGYDYGKRTLMSILRHRCGEGVPFREALDYEEDVAAGRVPK